MQITGDYADDDLLTCGQVRRALGLSSTTILHHTNSGKLKTEGKIGGWYHYRWKDVKAFAISRRKQRVFDARFFADVGTLYTNGMTIRQIAEAKNVNYATIHKRLVDDGIPLRPPGRRMKPLPPI